MQLVQLNVMFCIDYGESWNSWVAEVSELTAVLLSIFFWCILCHQLHFESFDIVC